MLIRSNYSIVVPFLLFLQYFFHEFRILIRLIINRQRKKFRPQSRDS